MYCYPSWMRMRLSLGRSAELHAMLLLARGVQLRLDVSMIRPRGCAAIDSGAQG
jgi:hypothetical protein